jgi:hypothetical protein
MRQLVSDRSDKIQIEMDEDDKHDTNSLQGDSDGSQDSMKDPVSIKLTVYTENINVSIPGTSSASLMSNLCEAGKPTLQANITIPETRSSRSNSMATADVVSSKPGRSPVQANLTVQDPRSSHSNSSVNSSTSDVCVNLGIPESDAIVNEVLVASNEPDIIRITKTRTPPSTLQYPSAPHNTLTFPVAPPRMKKRSSSEVVIYYCIEA